MPNEFYQHIWSPILEIECLRLLEIALLEDTNAVGDLTTLALVPPDARCHAAIAARSDGVVAGLHTIPIILTHIDRQLVWEPSVGNGSRIKAGTVIGTVQGPVSSLLIAERQVLNFLGRLSGIATLTRRYVDAVEGTNTKIFDTRKTTPGWRGLEKYAVYCGGGTNHRSGLYDAILIKDNHLAFGGNIGGFTAAEAVVKAKEFTQQHFANSIVVEVEVDTLQQLQEVLIAKPDLILLDNMKPDKLVEAVKIRNAINARIELEASGGITLETVRAVAETGVERISVGALTHSAVSLDFGLDWR